MKYHIDIYSTFLFVFVFEIVMSAGEIVVFPFPMSILLSSTS